MCSPVQSLSIGRVQIFEDIIGVSKSGSLLVEIVEAQATIGVQVSDFGLEVGVGVRFASSCEQVDSLAELLDRLLVLLLAEVSGAALFESCDLVRQFF